MPSKKPFHLLGLVKEAAVQPRAANAAAVPEGLQLPRADMQQAADLFPVEPRGKPVVSACTFQCLHLSDEGMCIFKERLENALFKNYYFHNDCD